MSKRKNNILMSLLLLIFVGQATASTLSFCPMMDTLPSNSSNNLNGAIVESMSGMNHSGHAMMESKQSVDDSISIGMMDMDCCDTSGHCQMAHCAMPMLSSDLISHSRAVTTGVVIDYSIHLTTVTSSNLYRPPISV